MSFLTGSADFMDTYTICGWKLSENNIYIDKSQVELHCLRECLPYLIHSLSCAKGKDVFYPKKI